MIERVKYQRIITMPAGMEPEWLAPQYRDTYVERCIQAAQKMLACESCRKRRVMLMEGLRKFQKGNFAMFPAGTQALLASADCSFTTSSIPNLFEFNIEPTDSYTHGRLFSDGDWYWNEATNLSWGGSRGTWQGGCAIADYDTRWNHNSGTVPNSNLSGTDGVWHAATTSAAVGYSRNFGVANGSFDVQCRDGTTLTLLFTDSFNMQCEVDPRN